jgi:hypothetical protein
MAGTAPSPQPDARDIGCATELEVKEVLACLQETLRDSAFASELALLAMNSRYRCNADPLGRGSAYKGGLR